MRELRLAVQKLDAERTGGVLNVSMMPSFLQKWLMPRLGAFQDAHADLDLRISADDNRVDFEQTDFHAAIRFGPGDAEGLVSEHLLEDWILPVCSPRFLELHGPFADTESLGRHALLFVDSPVWDPWFQTVGGQGRERRQKILNDALAILMAVELGEGIALTRWSLVARDLAAGRLVRPVDTLVPTDWSYYFTLPSHHVDMPKVQTFWRWLKQECDQFERPTPVTA
jgi:LysR family glycine cleavage system transcriptional activator